MKKLKYRIVIQWSDEDNCYLVGLPDFPGQKWRTHGNTYAESVKNAEEVRLFVTWYGSIGGHKLTKSLSGKRLN